jgi:hypothetical protein
VIGCFRYFIAFHREYSVSLSAVKSIRNLLIEEFLNALIFLVNCCAILLRFVLSCDARV